MSKPFPQIICRNSRILFAAVFGGMLCGLPEAGAEAADGWMYRRSYYSHEIPPEVQQTLPMPEHRSAYRPAVTPYGPGFAIRGGYRINRIFLQSGLSTDLTVIRQGWFDVRP